MTDDKPKYGERTPDEREWNARRPSEGQEPAQINVLQKPPASKAGQVGGVIVAVALVLTVLVPLGIFLSRWALGVL